MSEPRTARKLNPSVVSAPNTCTPASEAKSGSTTRNSCAPANAAIQGDSSVEQEAPSPPRAAAQAAVYRPSRAWPHTTG